MVSCAVRSCCSRSEVDTKKSSGITFHRFPKDAGRRKIWVQYLNRPNWQPTAASVLCSKHFQEADFDITSLSSVRLRDGAIPTVGGPRLANQKQVPKQLPERAHDDLLEPPSPKIRILSDILISPPKTDSAVPSEVESTSTSASIPESTPVTPRKQALLRKLRISQQVSRERKRKLSITRKKLSRRDQKLATMKNIIADLRKQNFMQEEYLDLLSKLGGPQELYTRQCGKARKQSLPKHYTEGLKASALTLHFYSPAAYNFVRRTFNTCLPHTRTLSRWYSSIDGEPGFTEESFEALKLKVSSHENKVVCGLIMDEMSIRQHEEWVAGKDKCYGYVDMGTGPKDVTLAKDALVLLLNCINGSWKLPVGYFLVAGMTGDQKEGLILQCLQKCYDVGVQVVSLTCDGAPVNITLANRLGCRLDHKNLKATFKHPSTNEDLAFFLDPCHMVKLVRNTLGEKGLLVDQDDEVVSWMFLNELHQLQEIENFNAANKLRAEHLYFSKQKMKVRLATQVFSESVATALKFCKPELKMPRFQEVDATVKFIMILNNLFDILNSKNLQQLGFKKPLSHKNYQETTVFLNAANKYIDGLKTHVGGTSILETNRHTGFLGLKVCIASLKFLYEKLIDTNTLQFLPVYKISQDHLELFFGSIRSHGGYNNNPTARQFQSAYKKLIVHVELRESFRGNCIPLEHIPILRLDPIRHINETSRNYRLCDTSDQDNQSNNVFTEHDYLPDPLSEFSKNIVAYIAGYVVHYLRKRMVCEECVSALVSETRELQLFCFIKQKDKKSLQYPSTDVLDICFRTEKIIKRDIIVPESKTMSAEAVVSSVLKGCVNTNVFSQLIVHGYDQYVLDNHRVLLIKSIALRYASVRITYLVRRRNKKSISIRHHSNKIVLFKGQ